jgi:hypothetical protein
MRYNRPVNSIVMRHSSAKGETLNMASFTGGCACRAIRYEFHDGPRFSYVCQCRDCQRATGSGHAPLAMFSLSGGSVRGEVHYHDVTGGSGNVISRGFCATCGSPTLITVRAFPDVCFVYAASLDDPNMFKPTRVIWNGSSCAWDSIDRSLSIHAQGA